MKVRLAARAARDLEHAVSQYEQELPGLGAALLQEVTGAIDFISAYPEASALWLFAFRPARRCLLQRFPYGLIYELKDGEAIVVAFAHQRRRPVPT